MVDGGADGAAAYNVTLWIQGEGGEGTEAVENRAICEESIKLCFGSVLIVSSVDTTHPDL